VVQSAVFSQFFVCFPEKINLAVETHLLSQALNFPFIKCSYCCACGLHPAIIAAILHKPIQPPAPVAWWQPLT